MLEGMKELAGEISQIGQETLPYPTGSPPEELEAAKQAWIAYSTPLWRQAGRSEEWIAQNIIDEWAASQEDILRRYLAGDFAPPLPPPPPELKWYEIYWPYLAIGSIGIFVTGIALSIKKK